MVSASCDPIISHHIPLFPENAFNSIQCCDVLRISPFEFIYTCHIAGSISHEAFPWPFCPCEVPIVQAFCDGRKQPRPRSA